MDDLYTKFFVRENVDNIVFYSTDCTYSFKDLDTLVSKISKNLYKEQIGIVGIYGSNSFYFVAAYLACIKLGIDIIPIAHGTPVNFIENILDRNCCKTIISDYNLAINNVRTLDSKNLEDVEIDIIFKDSGNLIMHSSGTSGESKSIVISIKSHLEFLALKKKKVPGVKALITSPFAHMNGLSSLETLLMAGASIALVNIFNPLNSLALIDSLKIQVITGTPTALARILNEDFIKYNLTSVKKIVVSSAPITNSLANKIKLHFNNASLKITYGSTEAGPGLFGDHPNNIPTPELSVGFPNEGVECRITNSILEIKSMGMMSEYNNTNINKITYDGFFITNDIFEVDNNGFYYFKGRADEMFTCGGDNLYPLDLETLLETNETIDSAVVIGIEDDIKGKKPYCFVVLKKDYKLDESDLKEFLSKTLKFNLIPRKIWQIDQVPLTNLNKPDKKYLINLAKELLK
jgi:acyl-coenzyme A synthetase/AMP-(fatty) acid ligase